MGMLIFAVMTVHFTMLIELCSLASVYFSNGTFLDVARIEGDSLYRQTMRRARPDDSIPGFPTELTMATQAAQSLQKAFRNESLPEELWQGAYYSAYMSQEDSDPWSMSCRLMPWRCRNDHIRGIYSMLSALKVASESLIGEELENPEYALPWYFPSKLQGPFGIIELASGFQAGLLTLRFGQASGQVAAKLYSDRSYCHLDPSVVDEMVLTIDYSRAALSINSFLRDHGIHEWKGGFHYTQLGTEALSRCRSIGSETSCRDKLVAGIRQAVSEPLSEPGLPMHFDKVILLGESAHDTHLSEALREVLQDVSPETQYPDMVLSPEDHHVLQHADPLVAAARGMAWTNWKRGNWREEDPVHVCIV